MMNQWKCSCGYLHSGKSAPGHCPVCKAPQSVFTSLLQDAQSTEEESICSPEFSEGCKNKQDSE